MDLSRFFKAVFGFFILFVVASQPAAAQSGGSDYQREIVNGVIQNIVQSVRDQLQRRRIVSPAPGALRFSGEEGAFDNRNPFTAKDASNPFSALAYAKAPSMVAAPASVWLYGANLVGSGDKTSTILGNVHTSTVTGAFDVTKIGIFTATDALTLIGTGSHSWANQVTPGPFSTQSTTPSTSGTLSYLNGGFSADFTTLASWTRTTAQALFLVVQPPDSSSLSYTANAQYRFDFPYSVWFEPTAGVTYAEIYSANFGTKLADSTEIHGGGRVGTEMKWMGYTVQPTLSGAAFRIVETNVTGAGLLAGAGGPVGQLGLRGSGKINVIWTPNFSSYIEAHASGVQGRTVILPAPGGVAGTSTIGAQAGLRYSWN